MSFVHFAILKTFFTDLHESVGGNQANAGGSRAKIPGVPAAAAGDEDDAAAIRFGQPGAVFEVSVVCCVCCE